MGSPRREATYTDYNTRDRQPSRHFDGALADDLCEWLERTMDVTPGRDSTAILDMTEEELLEAGMDHIGARVREGVGKYSRPLQNDDHRLEKDDLKSVGLRNRNK